MGAEILAINPAPVSAHEKYCEKKGFSFTILSDPGRETLRAYGALKLGGRLVQRTVYVVGPGGEIIFAEKGMPPDKNMMDAIREHRG